MNHPMQRLRHLASHAISLYFSTFAAAVLIAAIWVEFAWGSEPWILPGGLDSLWVQATFESIHSNGFFGSDPHLNWPDGLGIWSHPQFGFLVPLLAWPLTRILDLGSGFAAVWALVLAAGINSASCLFLFRSLVGRGSRFVSAIAAIALGISPFTLTKIEHLNVAFWFFVPLLLGACLRLRETSIARRRALLASIAVASVLSPLWWLIVAVALLVIIGSSWAIGRKWSEVIDIGALLTATTIGIVVQLVMYLSAAVDGQGPTRSAWDSNTYGGRLIDVVLSSPLLTSWIPRLETLSPGASVELSRVGLIGGIGVVVTIVFLLGSTVGSHEHTRLVSHIRAASFAALILFLAGGIGNLQAGIVILIGGESPARVWSRVIIVLAVVGVASLVYWYDQFCVRTDTDSTRTRRTLISVAIGVAALSIAVADMSELDPPIPTADVGRLESEAIAFLRERTSPCPVAQLPLDGVPHPRLTDTTGTGLTLPVSLRPYVPYILAPEYSWSIGPYRPAETRGLYTVPVVIAESDLARIEDLGYCAVLYDGLTADVARRLGVELQGRDLSGVRPQFRNERYAVVVLTEG